jgi:hypothetical protein
LSRKLPEGTYTPSRRERDRDTLRSEPHISSRWIAQLCARDPTKSAEVEKPFEVSGWINLRRNNAFVHRVITERSRRLRNPSRFHSRQISGGETSLEYRRESRIQDSQQRQRQRPFGARNLPRGRKKRKLRRELQLLLDWCRDEGSRLLSFMSKAAGKSHTEE